MTYKYNEFLNKYRIRNVRVHRDYDRIDYGFGPANNYTYRDETIDIELPRSGFENLIDIDRDFTKMWQDERDEAYMRKEHPAIKEAYDKYRMLLELYR
jgi:hypothetical protein